LAIVALGVVVGFPLLTALALQYVTSHTIVFVGLLPLATAVFGVLRGGERPRPVFWVFSVLGSLLVVGFAASQGLTAAPQGDLLMLRRSWPAALAMPKARSCPDARWLAGLLALVAAVTWWRTCLANISAPAWLSLGYVSLFSMLIGFVFWYRGLAQGGIAAVGQLQLLQPFFGLALAATLLHEQVSLGMLGVTVAVILCVAGAKKFSR
jgi:drug/metabolite transporter (DMT)-like permease